MPFLLFSIYLFACFDSELNFTDPFSTIVHILTNAAVVVNACYYLMEKVSSGSDSNSRLCK